MVGDILQKLGALGWAVGLLGFCWGVWVWLRNRKRVVRVSYHSVQIAHVRQFVLDVESWGVDLYDVTVLLKYRLKELEATHVFSPAGTVPQPFKLAQSFRFFYDNDTPHQPCEICTLPCKDVWVIVMSGVKEVKTIKGKKFRRMLNEVLKPDNTLPDKPPPETPLIPFRIPNKW